MDNTADPSVINKKEIMDHWGFHGSLGGLRYYLRLIRRIIFDCLARHVPFPGLAVKFHRMNGVLIGNHVYVGPRVLFDLMYPELISVGDNISIGMGTMVFAHSNPTCSIELKLNHYPRRTSPVLIKNGAWIAPGAIILPGVTIHENAVVGAGSVVTKDVPAYTVVAGNPAKVIKNLKKESE